MHLYVLARGQKDKMKVWMNDLSAQYLPLPAKSSPTGKDSILQLGVREVKIIELAFPEESLEEVLKIVRPSEDNTLKRIVGIVARILKLDKVPEYSKEGIIGGNTLGLVGTGYTFYRVLNDGVSVIGIGIKKDSKNEKGVELI